MPIFSIFTRTSSSRGKKSKGTKDNLQQANIARVFYTTECSVLIPSKWKRLNTPGCRDQTSGPRLKGEISLRLGRLLLHHFFTEFVLRTFVKTVKYHTFRSALCPENTSQVHDRFYHIASCNTHATDKLYDLSSCYDAHREATCLNSVAYITWTETGIQEAAK